MARNFTGIQWADERITIDPKYNSCHDELTADYRAGTSFRTFGILSTSDFNELHGLIFHKQNVELCTAMSTSISTGMQDSSCESQQYINDCSSGGVELVITS